MQTRDPPGTGTSIFSFRARELFFYAENTEQGGEEVQEFVIQAIIVALPIILTPTMGYVIWLLKRQKRDRDANGTGTMLLLRVQLIEYHEEWTKRGYTTKHGLENFTEMYEAYHALGGNGMVTHLMKEVENLPVKG